MFFKVDPHFCTNLEQKNVPQDPKLYAIFTYLAIFMGFQLLEIDLPVSFSVFIITADAHAV